MNEMRTVGLVSKALLALTLGVGAATMDAPAADAHATAGIPHHAAANVSCFYGSQGRTVQAFAPGPVSMRSVSGAIENVYWTSALYRYDERTGTWTLYAGSKGWLKAAANSGGLLGSNGAIWYNLANGNQLNNWAYTNLPAGHYAVAQFYFWGNGGIQHAEWSSTYNNSTSTGYCTVS